MSLKIPSKRKINTRSVGIYLQISSALYMSFIMFLRPLTIYFLHNECAAGQKHTRKINLSS